MPTTPQFRDPAEHNEASYVPDVARALDAPEDLLAEAFSNSLTAWKGDLPRTRAQFESAVMGIFSHALANRDPRGLASLLERLVESRVLMERAEAAMWVVALILDSECPSFTADCLAFATGLHSLQGGISETDIAKKYGVTKSGVSWRVVAYSEGLGLNPSRGMKDLEAKESYSERAHRLRGTPRNDSHDAKKASRRTRTIIGDVLRIMQWAAQRGNLALLEKSHRAALKKAFSALEPVAFKLPRSNGCRCYRLEPRTGHPGRTVTFEEPAWRQSPLALSQR